ncbi:MAG: 50S ribosomal protein L9 [Firmicutes bacterium]|nr:50S ribosomal protein L9 [Bacillota bacterium]
MKVILTQDIKSLGKEGQMVEVAEGYARNYLLPRGFAKEASKSNLRSLEERNEMLRRKEARLAEEARRAAEKLETATITIQAKSGEGGRLFGSITAKDIADGIKRVLGVEIDKRKIELPEPIKVTGAYRVPVRLHQDIASSIKVDVVAEPRGD